MNVEYLPFYEDEFFLRASDETKWDSLMTALKEIREPDDEEANLRGLGALLNVLSLNASENDEIIPIIARRFSRDLQAQTTDRGRSALLALESAVERYHFKEDCPSLDECVKRDDFRKEFIASDRWVDHNVAYEHILQKQVERVRAKEVQAKRLLRRKRLAEDSLIIPLMALLPFGLFLSLIINYITETVFSQEYLVVCMVLFSVEALAAYTSFQVAVLSSVTPYISSGRVTAILSTLILCVVTMVQAYVRTRDGEGPTTSAFCGPLALAQVFVGVMNISLIVDFRHLRSIQDKHQQRAKKTTQDKE